MRQKRAASDRGERGDRIGLCEREKEERRERGEESVRRAYWRERGERENRCLRREERREERGEGP